MSSNCRMLKFVCLLFLLHATSCLPSVDREERATFYFTNPSGTSCKSEDGRDGYCLLQGCLVNDLRYKGRCLGIGSCCLAEQSCSKVSNANNTYFINPSYPQPTTSLGSCKITIKRRSPKICQLRLDFLEFDLEQPNENGECVNDAFRVTGALNQIPVLCGSNTGQHMYLDVNPENYTETVVLSVDIKDITLLPRKWNIKVSQVDCASVVKAPSGCLQYYTSAEGEVKSFNFGIETEGTRQLANTEYGICVRPESGYCSLSWLKNENDAPYAFTLTDDVSLADAESLGSPLLSSSSCDGEGDYILIPNGVDEDGNRMERHCGLGFPERVTTSFKPFILHARTGKDEVTSGDKLNRGFSLKFMQNKC